MASSEQSAVHVAVNQAAVMEAKPLAGGIRYFWNAPSLARKRDCPIKSEAPGTDYAAAKARCDDI
jgi:hypothetical protein